MKTVTLTFEQRLQLGWLIGSQSAGSVADIRTAISLMDKLEVAPDANVGTASVNATHGQVVFVLANPKVAVLEPEPTEPETAEELAARDRRNQKLQQESIAENNVATLAVLSESETVELTDAEADFLAPMLAQFAQYGHSDREWIRNIKIVAAIPEPAVRLTPDLTPRPPAAQGIKMQTAAEKAAADKQAS